MSEKGEADHERCDYVGSMQGVAIWESDYLDLRVCVSADQIRAAIAVDIKDLAGGRNVQPKVDELLRRLATLWSGG